MGSSERCECGCQLYGAIPRDRFVNLDFLIFGHHRSGRYHLRAIGRTKAYDFSVVGINAAGIGATSAIITAVTNAVTASVYSITWNLLPSGPYTHGSGAIGINAVINPASSPVRFGFSTSASSPPSVWTPATLVNTNLWGAYVPTPPTVGTWYTWGEGLDGSGQTVSTGSFQVQ